MEVEALRRRVDVSQGVMTADALQPPALSGQKSIATAADARLCLRSRPPHGVCAGETEHCQRYRNQRTDQIRYAWPRWPRQNTGCHRTVPWIECEDAVLSDGGSKLCDEVKRGRWRETGG
eukprot:ctg_954.g332